MKKIQLFPILLIAVFAVSCGGALTSAQKEQVIQLVSDSAKPLALAKTLGSGPNHELQSSNLDELENVFQQGAQNCNVQQSGDPTSSFKFSVKGAQCPIVAEVSMSMNMSMTEMTQKMSMTFALQGTIARKAHDVFGTQFSMEMSASQNGASGKISGYIDSEKYGRVTLSGHISGDQNRMITVTRLEFKDFTAELTQEMTQSGQPKYTLNGETLSEEEVRRMMQYGGFGGPNS